MQVIAHFIRFFATDQDHILMIAWWHERPLYHKKIIKFHGKSCQAKM